MQLHLKREPQIHRLDKNKFNFIGVKISRDKIVLTSKVFLRAKRTAKRIKNKGYITVYDAYKIVSYGARFSHYDTHGAFLKYIESNVPRKKCRKIISERSKQHVEKSLFKGKAA